MFLPWFFACSELPLVVTRRMTAAMSFVCASVSQWSDEELHLKELEERLLAATAQIIGVEWHNKATNTPVEAGS